MTALIGLVFEIAYFMIIGRNALYAGIGWGRRLAINLFHLLRLTPERLRMRLAADDRDRLGTMFDGLDDAQIGMLLNNASWRRAEAGEQLTVERPPVSAPMLIAAGQASAAVSMTPSSRSSDRARSLVKWRSSPADPQRSCLG